MNVPVLFKHVLESGVIARAKQYEIKASHFLVDVLEDANMFLKQGYQMVAEGEKAVELFSALQPKKSKAADTKADTKAKSDEGKQAAK
jgi:hypothetical protein